MAQEENQGGQSGAADGGSGSQGGAAGEQKAANGEGQPPKAPQTITPEILQSVLERKDRTYQENLKKQLEGLTSSLEAKLSQKLEEALSKAASPTKEGGTKGGQGDNAAAILALEKDLKEAKARIEAEAKARADAEQSARDYKFQTQVEAALARNKCTNTGVGFLAIKPHLTYDAEANKITAKVKDTQFNLGDVDVDLETFIKTEFSENILPELFLGKVRPGAPAAGDGGGAGPGAKGVYRESDILKMPTEEYLKHRDKIEEARRAGRVHSDIGGRAAGAP